MVSEVFTILRHGQDQCESGGKYTVPGHSFIHSCIPGTFRRTPDVCQPLCRKLEKQIWVRHLASFKEPRWNICLDSNCMKNAKGVSTLMEVLWCAVRTADIYWTFSMYQVSAGYFTCNISLALHDILCPSMLFIISWCTEGISNWPKTMSFMYVNVQYLPQMSTKYVRKILIIIAAP